MTEKLFTDGDGVLFATEPGLPMKKFKIVSAIWDKEVNQWVYKITNLAGDVFTKIEEKKLTMD